MPRATAMRLMRPVGVALAAALAVLVGCHHAPEKPKQFGVVTADAIAAFRELCAVVPSRWEGVDPMYDDIGGPLKGRDIVRLSCSLAPERLLIYDTHTHRLLQLELDAFYTDQFDLVEQRLLFPVFDKDHRRAYAKLKQEAANIDIKALPPDHHFYEAKWKRAHTFLKVVVKPIADFYFDAPELPPHVAPADGRGWSVSVAVTEF